MNCPLCYPFSCTPLKHWNQPCFAFSRLFLHLFIFFDSHTRFMTPAWPQWQAEIKSCCHFVSHISLCLSGPWQPVTVRRGTHTKSHTDSHSLSLSHLLTENAIVDIQRNRRWGWKDGWMGWGSGTEGGGCWVVTLWKACPCVLQLSVMERDRDNKWKGEELISPVVRG